MSLLVVVIADSYGVRLTGRLKLGELGLFVLFTIKDRSNAIVVILVLCCDQLVQYSVFW